MRSLIHNMTRSNLTTVEKTNCRSKLARVILTCQGSVSGDPWGRKDHAIAICLGWMSGFKG